MSQKTHQIPPSSFHYIKLYAPPRGDETEKVVQCSKAPVNPTANEQAVYQGQERRVASPKATEYELSRDSKWIFSCLVVKTSAGGLPGIILCPKVHF